MTYSCSNCYYTNHCGSKGTQCIDYKYASEERIKELKKEISEAMSSICDIKEYEKDDAKTKEMLELYDKYFLKS